jgi:hypothetical protein
MYKILLKIYGKIALKVIVFGVFKVTLIGAVVAGAAFFMVWN